MNQLPPSIVVLGGGTAGFLAALAFRRFVPHVPVRLIRSKDIGIIGVGEGTTPPVVQHLHAHRRLGLDVGEFYRQVNPIWKLGVNFLWGPRRRFHYAFGYQVITAGPMSRPGPYFFQDGDINYISDSAALMTRDKAFIRLPNGLPHITHEHAYHLENKTFVAFLEKAAEKAGVTIIDDTMTGVAREPNGDVRHLHMESGNTEPAQLFVDCSGFAAALIGKEFAEPFESYKSTLYCDRAIVGGWGRGPDEPIQPYTTAETMDGGWSWRIDHEHLINRGYVYSSDFITDDAAEAEYRRKFPKVVNTRTVRFRSGRYRRSWINNVVAIGNAGGFVEPMEATAIAAICEQTTAVAIGYATAGRVTKPLVDVCNERNNRYWDAIRRFLAVHYKFNTLLDTPFWKAMQHDIDLAGAEAVVDYYKANGPDPTFGITLVDPHDQFGLGSYLTLLMGQAVPFENRPAPTPQDQAVMALWRAKQKGLADKGMTAEEALSIVRLDAWAWTPNFYDV